jgi:hypothetical protein
VEFNTPSIECSTDQFSWNLKELLFRIFHTTRREPTPWKPKKPRENTHEKTPHFPPSGPSPRINWVDKNYPYIKGPSLKGLDIGSYCGEMKKQIYAS